MIIAVLEERRLRAGRVDVSKITWLVSGKARIGTEALGIRAHVLTPWDSLVLGE